MYWFQLLISAESKSLKMFNITVFKQSMFHKFLSVEGKHHHPPIGCAPALVYNMSDLMESN
jgi:hypothetical protein